MFEEKTLGEPVSKTLGKILEMRKIGDNEYYVKPEEVTGEQIVTQLELENHTCAVFVFGGAAFQETGADIIDDLRDSLGRFVGKSEDSEDSVAFIDGGTQSGVMAVVAEVAGEHSDSCVAYGFFPGALVTGSNEQTEENPGTEPAENHKHVRVEGGEWTVETPVIMKTLKALKEIDKPVVGVMNNGGGGAAKELVGALDLGVTVAVVEDSGRSADFAQKIVNLVNESIAQKQSEEPNLGEIKVLVRNSMGDLEGVPDIFQDRLDLLIEAAFNKKLVVCRAAEIDEFLTEKTKTVSRETDE